MIKPKVFRVALSGTFQTDDGEPVFPMFDLAPLVGDPDIEFAPRFRSHRECCSRGATFCSFHQILARTQKLATVKILSSGTRPDDRNAALRAPVSPLCGSAPVSPLRRRGTTACLPMCSQQRPC